MEAAAPGGPMTGNPGGAMELAETAEAVPCFMAGDTLNLELCNQAAISRGRSSVPLSRLLDC